MSAREYSETPLAARCLVSSELFGLAILVDLMYQLLYPLAMLDPTAATLRNIK